MVSGRTLIISILGLVLLVVVVGLQALDALAGAPAEAGAASSVIALSSIRDNTMYQESDSLSNGQGQHFFAGAIQSGELRRGLVKFDIASELPANALIVSATLRLYVSKHPSIHGPELFSLHRVSSGWSEGASDAPGEEGSGTTAAEGDATWSFSFYSPTPTERIAWTNPGGDFLPTAGASATVDLENQFYTWGPSPDMNADLMHWLASPDNNYGWLLMGDESNAQTARRFDSRENDVPGNRPVLFVEYTTIQSRNFLPLIIGG